MLKICKSCGNSFEFKNRKGMTPYFVEVCSGKCFKHYINNFNYKEPDITLLGNIKFIDEIKSYRSSYEIRLAKWLNANNIPYLYEPILFNLPSGLKYLPDFFLFDNNTFIEVKGLWQGRAKRKFKEFASLYENYFNIILMDLESLRLLKN
jgi:hypothetical protein